MTPARRAALPLALLAAATVVVGCADDTKSGGDFKRTGTIAASGTGDKQTVSIDMTDDLTFVPNVIQAKVGALALTAKNVGRIPHNLVFADGSKGKLSTVKSHDTGTLTVPFGSAGTYRFTCTFHPGMDGEVVVTG